MRELAQRLLMVEAASQSASHSQSHEVARVCDKLRISLTRFAGADGFIALMRRALALARAEVPSLHVIQVKADGCVEGFETLGPEASQDGVNAAAAITAHLLGLLVTFVGEPITLKLVRDAWPEALLDE